MHFILCIFYVKRMLSFQFDMVGMKFCADILLFYRNNFLKINQKKFTCKPMHFFESKTSLQDQGENSNKQT